MQVKTDTHCFTFSGQSASWLFFPFKGGHGSAKWTQTSLICELGTWVYLKGYVLEN